MSMHLCGRESMCTSPILLLRSTCASFLVMHTFSPSHLHVSPVMFLHCQSLSQSHSNTISLCYHVINVLHTYYVYIYVYIYIYIYVYTCHLRTAWLLAHVKMLFEAFLMDRWDVSVHSIFCYWPVALGQRLVDRSWWGIARVYIAFAE